MVSEMPGTDAQHRMISLQCSIWTLTSQQELSTVMLPGTLLFGSKSGGEDRGQRTLISGRLEK